MHHKEIIISPKYFNFGEVDVFETIYNRIRVVNRSGLDGIRLQIQCNNGSLNGGFSWNTLDLNLSINEEFSIPILFEPSLTGYFFEDFDIRLSKSGFQTTIINIELAGWAV